MPVFCGFFQDNSSSVAVSMPRGNTFFAAVLMILSYSGRVFKSVRAPLPYEKQRVDREKTERKPREKKSVFLTVRGWQLRK